GEHFIEVISHEAEIKECVEELGQMPLTALSPEADRGGPPSGHESKRKGRPAGRPFPNFRPDYSESFALSASPAPSNRLCGASTLNHFWNRSFSVPSSLISCRAPFTASSRPGEFFDIAKP